MKVKDLIALKHIIITLDVLRAEVNRTIDYEDKELNTEVDLYSLLVTASIVAENIYNKQIGKQKWK